MDSLLNSETLSSWLRILSNINDEQRAFRLNQADIVRSIIGLRYYAIAVALAAVDERDDGHGKQRAEPETVDLAVQNGDK